jgi:predicted CopG family antitoxin
MRKITIEVNEDTAEKYSKMSPSEKQSISRDLDRIVKRKRNILEVMDDMSQQAKTKGLTSEILDELLNDE